jgi:23S rRNA (pseudouridine1915-N3)-methyltransferase
VWHKNDADLVSSVMADHKKQHAVILLDPRGKTYSSEKFSHQFFSWLDAGGSRATFIIGGADGLPPELNLDSTTMSKDTHFPSVSLSTLTMTHQFCRILLIEQIYRATEIRKGMLYLLPCLYSSSICCHLLLLFFYFFCFFKVRGITSNRLFIHLWVFKT